MQKRNKALILILTFVDLFVFSRVNLLTIPVQKSRDLINKTQKFSALIAPEEWKSYRVYTDQSSFFNPVAKGKPTVDMAQETDWQAAILRPNANIFISAPSIDGYASLIYNRYASLFGSASADPTRADLSLIPLELRRLLGAKYIVSKAGSHFDQSGLEAKAYLGDRILWQDDLALPRFFLVRDGAIYQGGIRVLVYKTNESLLTVESDGPATLVFGDVLYPGWRGWVDGSSVALESYRGTLKSINLTPGKHQVRFTFSPWSVAVGAGLSTLGVVSLIGLLVVDEVRRRHS